MRELLHPEVSEGKPSPSEDWDRVVRGAGCKIEEVLGTPNGLSNLYLVQL